MQRRTQLAVATGATVLALGAGTGAVVATGSDDDASQAPISGAAADRAERAALDAVGEGTVTGTEVDDEQSKYEVEVTKDDGSQVDVQLDADFQVVSQDADVEESEGAGNDTD